MRVLLALFRVSAMTAMQYRSNFLLDLVTALISTASRIGPLFLVYQHRSAVGGWEMPDALLVMAFFLVLAGVQGGLLEPNLGAAVESIRDGRMDLTLLKPADAQLLVSLRTLELSNAWDLLAAVVVGGVALGLRGLPTPVDALMAGVLLFAGLVALYGLWLCATCASFWFVRVDNLRFLLWSASDAGRWPITVFSGWVRWTLTLVIPVGLVTSYPVLALRGLWTGQHVAIAVGTAAAMLLVSRLLWKRSLASYTSASS